MCLKFFTWVFVYCIREGDLKTMDSEQLREYAHKMVDFIADYYKDIETFPVLSQVQVELCLQSFLPSMDFSVFVCIK